MLSGLGFWREGTRMAAPVFASTSWRKSTRSASNGSCVEVAYGPDVVGVRDSKNPVGGVLAFDTATWRAFVSDVRSGVFDQP
jgi:hypothetical protein